MKYVLKALPFLWLITAVSYAIEKDFAASVMAALLIMYSIDDAYK